MTKKILVIEPDKVFSSTLVELCQSLGDVYVQPTASGAIEWINEHGCDLAVVELSLGKHSGFEFIYEFRTYQDWQSIPVIVMTSIRLDDSVLKSRVWSALNIGDYLYKPETSPEAIKATIKGALGL